MKDRKLASRYARALLASLSDPAIAEHADQFLNVLRQSMEESEDFRNLLLDPAVAKRTRSEVLTKLAENAGMPDQIGNFLKTIVEHDRESSLPAIAEVFHEVREEAAGIVPAEITTAVPLPDDLKERTLKVLEGMTGRKVRLTTQLDPQILGGAVTKVGSTVYDGSLKTQLAQLRRKMTQE